MRTRWLVGGLALVLIGPAGASDFELEDADRYMEGGQTTALDIYALGPDESLDRFAEMDLDYAAGMRAHHYGAIAMSTAYLNEPGEPHPVLAALARSIIANQRFEMAALENIIWHVEQGPLAEWRLGDWRFVLVDHGVLHPRHFWQVQATRPPSPLDVATSNVVPTARDVRFAREMMHHHGAAIERAGAYNVHPDGRNRALSLLNLDIIRAQAAEIVLMQSVVDRYPGDARAVELEMIVPTVSSEDQLVALSREILYTRGTGLPPVEMADRILAMGQPIDDEARAEATPD